MDKKVLQFPQRTKILPKSVRMQFERDLSGKIAEPHTAEDVVNTFEDTLSRVIVGAICGFCKSLGERGADKLARSLLK